ncbi:peptidylprolyl isomerase [Candidatus Bipolaricaulota bacterium]
MRLRLSVCLLLVLMLGLIFSGCSNSPATTEPVATTQETSPESPETTGPSAPDVESAVEVASSAPEIDPDREVVALINGYPAYQDEFESAKNALLNQYAQTYAQFGMDISMLMGGADGRLFELGVEAEAFLQLTQLILTQQEADQQGIVLTDEEVQQDFDVQYSGFLAGQGWTEEDLALYLAQQGRTLESFKEDAKAYISNQLLTMKVQQAVAGPLDVTDQQIEEYFGENEANYGTAERVRASHILVETREEAEELLDQLNDGADFADLAREHSTDPGSGANGGDLNWFARGAMVAPFEEAAFSLTVGETSDIVETQYGFHIIQLTDRQDAALPVFAEIIDQVRTDLENELSYELAREWYNEVLSVAVFDIRWPMLDAIVKQTDDIDAAIEILEQAQRDGTSEDPYLPFVLGTFYERKLSDALEAKAVALDASETEADEDGIATLEEQIVEYRTQALTAFQLAEEAVGEDSGIRSKIEELQAAAGAEEETP